MTKVSNIPYDNGYANGYAKGFADGQTAYAETFWGAANNRENNAHKRGYEEGRLSVFKMIPTLMNELQKAYDEGQEGR